MSNIEVARRLIARGIPTAPMSGVNKRPLTAHGFKDRTVDAAQIEAWGARFPHCFWIIVPGDQGGIALDDDNATTRRIMAQLGLTGRATYRTITPGGSHDWFRNVAGLTGGANLSLADVGLPMDSPKRLVTRINAGYCIAPGCVRADGGRYTEIGKPSDMGPLPDAVAYVLAHHNDPDREQGERVARSRDRATSAPSVIDAFNRAHDARAILREHGYKLRGKRWVAPDSSTGMAGVVMLDGKVYSHHGSDPLADSHAHDPFDLFRILDHRGDLARAVRAAAVALGVAEQPKARKQRRMTRAVRAALVHDAEASVP
jgi:hypothetical protein